MPPVDPGAAVTMPGGRPYWWTPHLEDPLFDEFKRQQLRLLDAARELDDHQPVSPEDYRASFEAVLVGIALLVVLPAVLIALAMLFG
jgi:hypothetical protein